jgi:hypothetical protein
MNTGLRFLFLNTDYPEFLRDLYAEHPGLEELPYEEQMRVRNESLFGVADFYPANMCKLGHEAHGIHVNNEFMQKMWTREHGLTSPDWRWQFRLRRKVVPWVSRLRNRDWFYDILAAQIKHYKPDVLLNQAMDGISGSFLKEIKPYVKLLAGQHAATQLVEFEDWNVYDLVISSFPPTLKWLGERNVPAELHRLGFDERTLIALQNQDRGETIPVSFVGSLGEIHQSRMVLLERLSEKVPLVIWGPTPDVGFSESRLANCYRGTAWGIDMYNVLRNSLITLNHHGNVAAYANNMRLYEATGTGTLLVTDWKENLHEVFEPGKEVIAYRTPEECAELIQYYLEHDNEREAIARAGQQRTLREHTYHQRMQELLDIVRKYI